MTSLRRIWSVLGYGFVALVVYLSLTDDPPDLGLTVGLDPGHVVAYLWLMIWFAQLHRGLTARVGLAIAFFAMGAGLEYLQGALGYRHFDYDDMLRNLAGLAIGLLLALTPLQNVLPVLEARAAAR